MEKSQILNHAKKQITQDIIDGVVPRHPKSFSELHSYVDANYYGGFLEDGYEFSEGMEFENEIQNDLDKWIKQKYAHESKNFGVFSSDFPNEEEARKFLPKSRFDHDIIYLLKFSDTYVVTNVEPVENFPSEDILEEYLMGV